MTSPKTCCFMHFRLNPFWFFSHIFFWWQRRFGNSKNYLVVWHYKVKRNKTFARQKWRLPPAFVSLGLLQDPQDPIARTLLLNIEDLGNCFYLNVKKFWGSSLSIKLTSCAMCFLFFEELVLFKLKQTFLTIKIRFGLNMFGSWQLICSDYRRSCFSVILQLFLCLE